MINKRGLGAWIWILIILILIAIGIGIYFWLTGGEGGSINSVGNLVPQPPELPN